MNSFERVLEYCEEIDQEPAKTLDTDPKEWPIQGEIQIADLTMAYHSKPEVDVLKNINLSIKAGEKIGVVGRTGSGKSTLAMAFFRIMEPKSGTIIIDGTDITKIGISTLRSNLFIISQEANVFTGTIRYNLSLDTQYSDEELWEALHLVGLKEYVSQLPDKLDHQLVDNGSNLSVGQGQLLCLARAIAKKPKVLILDEASSSIDGEADKKLQQVLRKELVDTTIISIAHRLNTIADFDRVMVLDQGELIEFDSPFNLLSDQGSEFSKLVDASGSANSVAIREIAEHKHRNLDKISDDFFKKLTKGGRSLVIRITPRVDISSLTLKFTNLRLEVNPKAGSAYSATAIGSDEIVNAGLNGIFPTVNLPTIVRDAINYAIDDKNLDFPLTIVKNGLLFSMFCKKVPETSKVVERTVDGTLSDLYSQFFKTDSTYGTQTEKFTMRDLNAEFGLATSTSKPGFVHTTTLKNGSRFGLALIEFKDTAHAPLEQIGQAFACGSNIILSHFRLGLEWSECAIPLVITNGNLYQFGWVTLLEPSFPVLHITTGVLDASIPLTRELIAKHLIYIKEFCFRAEERIQSCSSLSILDPQAPFGLNMDRYHRKSLKDVFLRWQGKPEESLGYLWQIYEHLAGVVEAVLPLACETSYWWNRKSHYLEKDFAMGVPSDKELYQKYLQQLREAIRKIHQVGVIHVDLYPSNILWRFCENKMVLCIVDWDAATLQGDSFTETMQLRLANKENSAYYWKIKGEAEPKCDYWFLFILSNLTDKERESMSGEDPSTVNIAYKLSVHRQREDNKHLDDTFVQWYNSEFSE